MHNTWINYVKEFHEAFGQPIGSLNWGSDIRELEFRSRLHIEEARELQEAMKWEGEEDILKELCDNLYVLLGTAVAMGWNVDKAFRLVHESNMSKLVDGKAVYRGDGKVLKGPKFKSPDLSECI